MNELRVRGLSEGPFQAAVLDVVAQIPAGRVTEYGDIAEYMGYGRDASALVGWVIRGSAASGTLTVPWHRVICEDGKLPEIPNKAPIEQALLLGNEGIDVLPGPRVELETYRWKPKPGSMRGPIESQR